MEGLEANNFFARSKFSLAILILIKNLFKTFANNVFGVSFLVKHSFQQI